MHCQCIWQSTLKGSHEQYSSNNTHDSCKSARVAARLGAEECNVGPQPCARHEGVVLRAHHKHQRLPADGHLRAASHAHMKGILSFCAVNLPSLSFHEYHLILMYACMHLVHERLVGTAAMRAGRSNERLHAGGHTREVKAGDDMMLTWL